MRAAVLALVLAFATRASADDGIHRRVDADTDNEDEPLTLDPALRFAPLEGLATTTTDDQKRSFALGPRTRAELEARTWSDGFTVPGQEPGLSGWTAAGRYDVELAWGIHLEVDASLMKLAPAMNGMFDNGMVAAYGAALTKYLHWGHGNTAWISLGVEHTELVGARSVGVPHGTTVGLRVGTTF